MKTDLDKYVLKILADGLVFKTRAKCSTVSGTQQKRLRHRRSFKRSLGLSKGICRWSVELGTGYTSPTYRWDTLLRGHINLYKPEKQNFKSNSLFNGKSMQLLQNGSYMSKPWVPCHQTCSTVLDALQLLNQITRRSDKQRITVIEYAGNKSVY